VNQNRPVRPRADDSDAGRERSERATLAIGGDGDCGDQRTPASELSPVNAPERSVVLRNGLGLSETGLNVYFCLRERGSSTTKEVAERLDLDRSTVARSLNRLAEVELVDQNERLLESGGRVNVYSINRTGAFAEQLRRGLLAWAVEALDCLEAFTDERWRIESSDEPATVYWDA